MRYESYAQELEDIILFVVLRDVEKGFYIDIGANDPLDLSVTHFFYERGWQGINIEPLRSKCLLLEEKRPRDINLCIGISNKVERRQLIAAGTGSTFKEDVAQKGDFIENSKFEKCMLTLTEVANQYCASCKTIHFCKIDVEGYEKEVLEGIRNWDVFRPWIYIVESAEPGTTIPSYEPWENILLNNGYIYAYGTGIERYYVDERKEHLLDRFKHIDAFIKENEIVRMKMEPLIFKNIRE